VIFTFHQYELERLDSLSFNEPFKGEVPFVRDVLELVGRSRSLSLSGIIASETQV
jgi:hypothetical protein